MDAVTTCANCDQPIPSSGSVEVGGRMYCSAPCRVAATKGVTGPVVPASVCDDAERMVRKAEAERDAWRGRAFAAAEALCCLCMSEPVQLAEGAEDERVCIGCGNGFDPDTYIGRHADDCPVRAAIAAARGAPPHCDVCGHEAPLRVSTDCAQCGAPEEDDPRACRRCGRTIPEDECCVSSAVGIEPAWVECQNCNAHAQGGAPEEE